MAPKPIFGSEPLHGGRMLVLLLVSILLMSLDNRHQLLQASRKYLGRVIEPLQIVLNAPGQQIKLWQTQFGDRQELLQERLELKEERLYLLAKTQRMQALERENAQLRYLMQGPIPQNLDYLLAEVIQVDPYPFKHAIVVNRGQAHGVSLGQPVLDAYGLMGKVVEVSEHTARIMLITDASHAIPIENSRNGIRAILAGTGDRDHLELQHVPNTMNIRVGDALLSSGLGGGYPAGFPVGTVQKSDHDAGASFTTIWVKPKAQLEISQQLLLIHSGGPR